MHKLPLLARLIGVSILAFPAFSQTFGEITGTVTDSTSAVVGAATVVVTNTATGQVRRVETNETGNYTAPFLPPGVYSIRVEKEGFKAATRGDVRLQVADSVRVNFIIEVGSVTESIEVQGGAPLLTTESGTVGTVIDNRRIVELPLNGRNYLQMVALSPNVSAEQGAGGEAAARKGGTRTEKSLSVAGARNQFNHYTLDGLENTDMSYNIYALQPSIDALQEFKVETGVYSAEFGRAAVQINVATKAGANDFHGTLFEFVRSDSLDAKEYKKVGDKNPFLRNQFGFTLGGRLIRDKLFFMSNFETLREEKTLQGLANVAPDRMRAGDFSASGRNVFDPSSRVYSTDAAGNPRAVSATPFPNNIIPTSRFHPISAKLLEFYPKSQRPGDNILGNFVRQRPRPITWEQFNQRIDYTEDVKSTWFGRYSWSDEDYKEIADFEDQEANILTRTKQALLSNIRTFTPTVVNEFRFGFTEFKNDQARFYAYKRDVTGELGIKGLASPVPLSYGTPSIGLGLGLSGFGEQGNGPFVGRTAIFQWIDNMSIIRGKHSFRFGGEIRRDRYNETGNAFTRGSFGFGTIATMDPANRAVTGHPFADYLLGEVSTPTRARVFSNGLFRATVLSAYFQDTWRITPKLTAELGLRYEFTPPYHDKYRGIMNVIVYDSGVYNGDLVPGAKVPVMIRPGKGDFHEGLPFRFNDGVPTTTGDDLLGPETVKKDYNDLAPRVSLAYRPTENWTVRTGAGVFYVQDIVEARFDLTRNVGGRSQFTADSEKPNANFSDPWKYEGGNCANYTGPCQGPTFTLANNTNRRTPYIIQWLFNVQRQIGQDTVFEVGYLGNGGHKLELLRVWNQPVLRKGPNDSRSLLQRSPFPAYGLIQTVDSHANSNYHGLALKAQRRFAKGLTYLAGFTWSKATDQGSSIRNNTGENQFATDNYNLRREHSLSQFHNGHRFVSSLLYELPFGKGKKFLSGSRAANYLVGGWQLGSIITLSDGTPINVGQIGDPLQIGTPNVPDASGISPIPANRTPDNFWNAAAFNATNPELLYRFGNTGRNLLTTPGLKQWDFSLTKETAIREHHRVEFRFEAFNFPNHPNFAAPATDVRSAATFGKITSARTMREMQFGVKYLF
ncbi:MAG: TonB-dependent receptor [Bryobacterales bacterium]|nr:TonB-dependent receptor [Bryobacterales bacterium]